MGSALLGSAGSAIATAVSGWLSPLLLCASILLMLRSFYVIYVRKIRSRTTVIVTWFSFSFMVGFWSWYLLLGGEERIRELF
jgi:hypothetical protein